MKRILLTILTFFVAHVFLSNTVATEFQGRAYYVTKSTLELGSWGARLSEAQKKQIQARLKNRLEKTYILEFNKEEATFREDEKLDVDAISGATDSWGKNFSPGKQYKNVRTNALVQSQEFYGKQFLVKDKLPEIQWQLGTESKQIGNYMCFKASALIPSKELSWYDFSWSELRAASASADADGDSQELSIPLTEVTAWYTPQIPVLGTARTYTGSQCG